MTDDVLTARDLYAAVLAMERDPAVTDRSLQSCLGSLHTLAGAWSAHSRIPFASFVALLQEAFDGVPRSGARPPDEGSTKPPAHAIDAWRTTIVGQIADLRAMDLDGSLRNKYRHFGQEVRRDAGPDDGPTWWYNTDPVGYLECAASGTFGYWENEDGATRSPAPPIGSVDWETFTRFLLNGQTYE